MEDKGLTEFKGVKTKIAIAIGPAAAEKIDKITEHLKLL
ncbi:MAG: peptidyl-tRNA hydrolase [Nanoarchaeota archaeon]